MQEAEPIQVVIQPSGGYSLEPVQPSFQLVMIAVNVLNMIDMLLHIDAFVCVDGFVWQFLQAGKFLIIGCRIRT